MPRSDFEKHFPGEVELREKLLQSKKGQAILERVREQLAEKPQGLTRAEFGRLVNVPGESISGDLSRRHLPGGPIAEAQAREEIVRFLPKVLRWRPVTEVARELGEHRNTVESIVRQYGKPGMLLRAPDHNMYVSPSGLALVRKKKVELAVPDHYPRLSDVAAQLEIGNNLARSFFYTRKIPLRYDLQGRIRLTPEQAADLARWRYVVHAWREGKDVVLQGQRHRPIKTIVAEKAALFEQVRRSTYNRMLRREETALRFFCRSRAPISRTNTLHQYVKSDVARAFINTTAVSHAARLMSVSESTIKHWREQNGKLAPPPIPGKKTIGVYLPELLMHARQRYEEETKLSRRDTRPAALIALPLQAAALKAGVDFKSLVRNLNVPGPVKDVLLTKKGEIPKREYEKLTRVLVHNSRIEEAGASYLSAARYLLKKFEPTCPVGPAVSVQGAIELVALQRGVSPNEVYADAVSLFRLPEAWPQTFEELQRRGRRAPAFPLAFVCYVNALMDPHRGIIAHDKITPSTLVRKGDLFVHRELADFGFIEHVEQGRWGPIVKVNFACGGELFTFDFSDD